MFNTNRSNKITTQYEGGIIAESPNMKEVIKIALRLAPINDSTVLIWGETGVGKEGIARLVHDHSGKANAPFVTVNCGAIPDNLLESELFGYEEGSFTGAKKGGKPGKFEAANGGTILLDEIGDMPLHLQVKLLRVLQDKEVVRIGGNIARPFSARILASTNKDLRELVLNNSFREDLYFRLNVVPIYIPPLRERKEDIMPLILFFKQRIEDKLNLSKNCSDEVIKVFLSYDWPGNVRELENVLHRLYLMTEPDKPINAEILIKHFFQTDWKSRHNKRVAVHKLGSLKDITREAEEELIKLAMEKCRTLQEVADLLEVNQSTISRKIHKLGLKLKSSKLL